MGWGGRGAFERGRHFQTVRPGAILSSHHVAAEPSEVRRAGTTVQLAKLSGVTGPYLSPVHGNAVR